MSTHHPPSELLLDYSAGSLAAPVALAVATHLSLCGDCRARSENMDALGGALLRGTDPAALGENALAAVMDRLDAPAPASPPAPPRPMLDERTRAVIPAPLRPYLSGNLDALNWRRRGRSMEEVRLPLPEKRFRASLFRIRPGGAAPAHTHAGNEYVVLLEGSFSEDGEVFAVGDFVHADSSRRHIQVADPVAGCICLAVLDGPVRLTGPLGILVNPFLRF